MVSICARNLAASASCSAERSANSAASREARFQASCAFWAASWCGSNNFCHRSRALTLQAMKRLKPRKDFDSRRTSATCRLRCRDSAWQAFRSRSSSEAIFSTLCKSSSASRREASKCFSLASTRLRSFAYLALTAATRSSQASTTSASFLRSSCFLANSSCNFLISSSRSSSWDTARPFSSSCSTVSLSMRDVTSWDSSDKDFASFSMRERDSSKCFLSSTKARSRSASRRELLSSRSRRASLPSRRRICTRSSACSASVSRLLDKVNSSPANEFAFRAAFATSSSLRVMSSFRP
mmetsp:Transcript_91633/g.263708  ORF Transcript_91633/g.263708 Transcript_91633/m.263708 type:complete len:296 (+) Transcript_91633:116-1003(+)